MKSFKQFFLESYEELEEQKMSFQDAEKLKNKHLIAMQHHKKSGNSKGYAAHSMVVDKFEDVYDHHGTGIIPAARILAASQKAFKDYPHSSMKEEVELEEELVFTKRVHGSGPDVHDIFHKGKFVGSIGKHFPRNGRPEGYHVLQYTSGREPKGSRGITRHERINSYDDAKKLVAKHFNESVNLDEGLFGGGKKIEDHHYTLINTNVNKRVGHGTVWKTKEGAERYHNQQKTFSKDAEAYKAPHMKVMTVGDAKKRGVPEHNFHNLSISEEVELDESITKLSHSRLKFHATKGVPHGSYTNSQIKDEHNRRLRTEPEYKNAKPSLSEGSEFNEAKKPKPGHNAAVMAKNIVKVLGSIKKSN